MALPYAIREGFAGFRRAKFAALASTSAMAVALVLIGLFTLIGIEAQQVSDWLRQRVGEVEIFLDEVDESQANALTRRATLMPGVETTEYISRQEAEEIFQREFGEGAEVFFDQTFLPASIRVQVTSDYANPDSLNGLVAEFQSWNHVDEVVFNQPLLVKVQENLRILTLSGIALGALVVVAAMFLVGNTIRLTIYARRLLIRSMKLVGATDSFVQRPFLVEGVLQGALAGLLSGGLLWGVGEVLAAYVPQLQMSVFLLVALFASLILLGIILGWLGSFVAVRRFIRQVALH